MLEELRIVKGMAIFCVADLKAEFDSDVHMYDARLSGYGIVKSIWEYRDLCEVCDYDERWRFKDYGTQGHRSQALFLLEDEMSREDPGDELFDIYTVIPPPPLDRVVNEDPKFPDVPARLLHKDQWHKQYCAPLKIPEPVHLCEARAALYGLRCGQQRLQLLQ